MSLIVRRLERGRFFAQPRAAVVSPFQLLNSLSYSTSSTGVALFTHSIANGRESYAFRCLTTVCESVVAWNSWFDFETLRVAMAADAIQAVPVEAEPALGNDCSSGDLPQGCAAQRAER